MAVLTAMQLSEVRLLIEAKQLVPSDFTSPTLDSMIQVYEDWYEANTTIPARDMEHDFDWPNVEATIDAATSPYTFGEGMKKLAKECYLVWKKRQPPQTQDITEVQRNEIRAKQRRRR